MVNKFKEFKKGDFVVLLLDAAGRKSPKSSMPTDYIYRLKEDVTPFCFEIEIDNTGYKGNGWGMSGGGRGFGYEMRKASFKEVEAYIRNGNKPCPSIDDEKQLSITDNLNELSNLLKKMEKLKIN